MKKASIAIFCVLITVSGVYVSNPTEPTTRLTDIDGDGLSNEYEKEHGIDPYDVDTDGDGIEDGMEARGQTLIENGSLDPLHKDLVVVFGGSDESKIDEYDTVKRIFENAHVENPDNETGVDVHVREKRLDTSVEWNNTTTFYDIQHNYEKGLLSGEMDSTVVVLSLVDNHPEYGGYADTEDEFAVVGDHSSQRLVVHELLHLVVGNFQIDDCDSSSHLCEDRGLLYPTVSSDMSRLSSDTRQHINQTGLDA